MCINCGAKLKRDDADADAEGDESPGTVDEPSKFEPSISEDLRRLRDRATGEGSSRRRSAPTGAGIPKIEFPNLFGGSRILGMPAVVWALFAVVFVITLMVLSNLQ